MKIDGQAAEFWAALAELSEEDRAACKADLLHFGRCFMQGGKRVPPESVYDKPVETPSNPRKGL